MWWFFIKTQNINIEQQTIPGLIQDSVDESQKKGLPDALIFDDEKCLIIESKVSSTLTSDQLRRHENTIRRREF